MGVLPLEMPKLMFTTLRGHAVALSVRGEKQWDWNGPDHSQYRFGGGFGVYSNNYNGCGHLYPAVAQSYCSWLQTIVGGDTTTVRWNDWTNAGVPPFSSFSFVINGQDCTDDGPGTARKSPANRPRFSGASEPKAATASRLTRPAGAPTLPVYSCGAQPGTPGAGGDPPEQQGSCPWYRDYVIWSDGTWDWVGGWYQDPDCAEYLRVSASLLMSPAKDESFRARLVARGPLENGLVAEVERMRGNDPAVEVAIDTSRASARDVENALLAAQRLADTEPRADGGRQRTAIADASATARSSGAQGGHGSEYLQLMLHAPPSDSVAFGRGRIAEVDISRRE